MLFIFGSPCETSKDRFLLGNVTAGYEREIAIHLPLSTYVHVLREPTQGTLLILQS